MRILPEAYPLMALSAALAALLWWLSGNALWAVPPAVFAVYVAYFFRDPEREIPRGDDLLLSPADGRVMEVSDLDSDDFIREPCTKIVIFMSPFDVHVNRSPLDGEIAWQEYVCGRFKPAYGDGIGFVNERHMLGIERRGLRITVTQIAGVLARRIVSWVKLGDTLRLGERYGLIRFGSCTVVVVPKSRVAVTVGKGERVAGGLSIIGRINGGMTDEQN